MECYEDLPALLGFLADRGGGRLVIVPGGGSFANSVRDNQQRLGFDDAVAHKMAVLAMEQYACYLMSLLPELQASEDLISIEHRLAAGGLPIWLPWKLLSTDTQLPRNWQLTSDSLAAWLAISMGAESLVLVKSAQLPGGDTCCGELARQGLVDGYLVELLEDSGLQAYCLNRDNYSTIMDSTPGIRIR